MRRYWQSAVVCLLHCQTVLGRKLLWNINGNLTSEVQNLQCLWPWMTLVGLIQGHCSDTCMWHLSSERCNHACHWILNFIQWPWPLWWLICRHEYTSLFLSLIKQEAQHSSVTCTVPVFGLTVPGYTTTQLLHYMTSFKFGVAVSCTKWITWRCCNKWKFVIPPAIF